MPCLRHHTTWTIAPTLPATIGRKTARCPTTEYIPTVPPLMINHFSIFRHREVSTSKTANRDEPTVKRTSNAESSSSRPLGSPGCRTNLADCIPETFLRSRINVLDVR